MNMETRIGLAASVLTTVSLLPQLVKIFRERKAESISSLWIAILFAGLLCWIFYGFLKKDLIIIISNIVSALINASIGIAAIIFNRKTKRRN
jgi:MtN3 and saliva related transmembrane protein